VKEPSKLNILIAYPYFKGATVNTVIEAQEKIRLVVDSGAFTAWKAGKPIELDDYCRFLEGLPVEPWRYFTLDVIGDPGATLKNYETMLRRGFKPVPIFTRGEDPSVLDDLYKTSDVVGVGGLVGTQGNAEFVSGIMAHAAGRRVHLLGFTRMAHLRAFRPYMCDASSWESGARYASLPLYLGSGKIKVVGKQDFRSRPSQEICRAICRLGVDPRLLAMAGAWTGGYSVSRRLCALSGVALSRDVQRNLGTNYFLAVAADCGLRLLIEAHDFFTQGPPP
jgi:hypothetical protein